MKAMVQIGSEVIEFDTGRTLPLTTTITARKCPASPVKVYALALSMVDNGKNVAVYRVTEEKSA